MCTRRLQSPLAMFVILVAIGLQPAWAQHAHKTHEYKLWVQEYKVTDLGASGVNNQTWSVNLLGQVAGYSRLSDGHGNYHYEGFFYDGITIDYIGSPGNAMSSDLLGVNDLGESVGKTWGNNGRAILRRINGSVMKLGTLGGTRSYAKSINNSSQVVGSSKLAGDTESRPFIWEDGVMNPLPLLGGGQGEAEWINNAGQIVGSSTTDTHGLQQFAVIWEGGVVTQLPPIHAGLNNIAVYIHNNGDIAGTIRIPDGSSYNTRAAIWRDGQVHLQLGTLADGTPAEPYASSSATGVNASGVAVGMSVNAKSEYVPFVYLNGKMRQLDDLMPDPWIALFVGAGAVNDVGQIAVSARLPGGSSRALLLTP